MVVAALLQIGLVGTAERVARWAVVRAADGTDKEMLASAYASHARVAERQGDLDRGIALMTKAVEAEPDDGWWPCELGFLYKAHGDFAAAAEAFSKAHALFGTEVSETFRTQLEQEQRECASKTTLT
jgi:Flp pilus assembly protein TadD